MAHKVSKKENDVEMITIFRPLLSLTIAAQLISAHYPEYPDRKTTDLTGEWDFGFSELYNVTTGGEIDPYLNGSITVPKAWDAAEGPLQYTRGVGFYRKQLNITAHHPSALHFEACSLWCRVLIDGEVFL